MSWLTLIQSLMALTAEAVCSVTSLNEVKHVPCVLNIGSGLKKSPQQLGNTSCGSSSSIKWNWRWISQKKRNSVQLESTHVFRAHLGIGGLGVDPLAALG